MGTPGANQLPLQTPNTSQPIASGEVDVTENGSLVDSRGNAVTGLLNVALPVTAAWRYLFGTFIQRSNSVSPTFTLTAGIAYSQTQMQTLIAQVEALSKVVGTT